MDKLVLNISILQEAVAQLKKVTDETREAGRVILEANKKLTAPGTWQGDGANAYKGKANQWNRNFREHEITVSQMNAAMKTVLTQAETLNRQALAFAGIVGGSTSGGKRNILTYDPNAKTSAIAACDKAISQIDSQLDQARKAEGALSGVSGFSVSSDLSTYRKVLSNQKNKLHKLKQAIINYAASAETLIATAARVFGGIDMPKGAIATLKSWGITHEEICDMLKGLNLGCNMYGGDPVNMATGNFVYEKEYLKLKGLFPISFKMFYNAQEKRVGALGSGWVHNFGVSLKKGENAATLHLEDGQEEIFYKNENGTYTQNFNKYESLRKTAKGHVYQRENNLFYKFDEDGRNTEISDLNGNCATLVFDQDKLIRVENNSGGVLAYEYSPEGNITQVSDHTGRTIQLTYEDGKVCSVTGEEGQEQKYQYNEKGMICDITNPLGIHILANEYDMENHISKQTFPDGGVMQYSYRGEEKELHVTEQNGNEIVYVHDDRMRSSAVVYSDGEERFAYNEQNQRTWQIDKNGNETRYDYDEGGNISLVTNALGETISVEHNGYHKPTKISVCDIEQMSGEYDEKGNLLNLRDALSRSRSLSYNENGQPVRITQPDGSVIEFAYDGRGNIVSMSEDGAPGTKYEYDGNNRVVAVADPNGNKTRFGYNRRDEMVKVVNAEGRERTYAYNQAGMLIMVKDFDGGVIQYAYNAMNKPIRYVDPGGQETRLEYDLMLNVTKQINANGAETQLEYDKLQRMVKVTNALGDSVKYDYDPNGNRTCITDPQGGQVHLEYDALNRVVGVTEADGAKSSVTYDEMGNITSITDAMGQERAFSHDAAGQKIEETDPMGNKTSYTYTLLGKISSFTDPAGRVTKYEYAPGGLLSREIYPDGRWICYEYDAAKNVISRQDQSGYTLRYTYDTLNRIVKIGSNCGQERRYTYDAADQVTSMTDANGNTTRYVYSATGNLAQVIDALGNKSEYGYDNMGELIRVVQFDGFDEELAEAQALNDSNSQLRVTIYHRNLLGQVEQIEDALGQRESYGYDALGRLTDKTDKDGYLTRYAYGQNGQLEHIQYADGKSVRLSYDPLRRLTEIRDWLGQTTIETDPLGRETKVQDHNGKEVQYLYGAGGELLETAYPDGKKASYSYDFALRLRQLTDGEGTITYGYDDNSRLSEKQFPNGMNTRYEYNDMGSLSALTHSDSEGILDKHTYRYDLMGNKTCIEKSRRGLEADSGTFNYGYDALGRLINVEKNGELLRTYVYDPFGNRSRMTEGEGQTSYTYNVLNQLMRAETQDLARDYRYDARGNVTGVLENGITRHTYEFGALNRLEKATNIGGLTSLYQYNSLGQRVGRQVTDGLVDPMQSISYVLDLTKQYHNLLQTDEDGRTKSYLWDSNVVSEGSGEGYRFYMQDELGSPLRFAGADGRLVDSYAYDEFGNDISRNQGLMQPFGYTGYRYDDLAATYFAQAREYDPLVGRFYSIDTIKGSVFRPYSLNEYTYCYNNPILFIDPQGLDSYILYDPYIFGKNSGKAYAAKIEKQLSKYYKTPVHLISVSSNDAFVTAWDDIGSNGNSIDGVVMLFHANEGQMSFKDKKGNKGEKFPIEDVQNLNNPREMSTVFLLGCNMGYGSNSIAEAFMSNQNINQLIAGSGYISHNKLLGYTLKVTNDGGGHYAEYPDSQGLLLFTKGSDSTIDNKVIGTLGKRYSITSVLEGIG